MVRYEEDFYAWAQETATALLERRFDQIDVEHAADEILAMSKSEAHAVESRLIQIMLHLLKIRYQPGKHTRSWDLSIAEQRNRLQKRLRDSPSLRVQIPDLWAGAYINARLIAARQTGLELDVFPEECPFTFEEVTGDEQLNQTR